jgi:hypothetical protein
MTAPRPSAARHAILFPDAWRAEQRQRLDEAWDFGYPLPVPRQELDCPVCHGFPLMLKDWRFHIRVHTGSDSPWRCDVRMKCPGCSFVAAFGLPVSQDYYQARSSLHSPRRGRSFSWRQGRRVLAEAGYVDSDQDAT